VIEVPSNNKREQGVEHPTGFRGPNVVLGLSLAPMLLWCVFLAWWMAYFRPSGLERWGDGVVLFYVLFAAYSLTLVLWAIGGVWAIVRWRKSRLEVPRATIALIAVAVIVLAVPPVLLLIPGSASQ
jgi:hypothetical protein